MSCRTDALGILKADFGGVKPVNAFWLYGVVFQQHQQKLRRSVHAPLFNSSTDSVLAEMPPIFNKKT